MNSTLENVINNKKLLTDKTTYRGDAYVMTCYLIGEGVLGGSAGVY